MCGEVGVRRLSRVHHGNVDTAPYLSLGPRPGDLHRYLAGIRSESRDLAQLLMLVGLGGPAPPLPASVAARYPRPGVVYRPVPDAPPSVLTIAWPQQARSPATAALIRAATSVADAVRDRQAG